MTDSLHQVTINASDHCIYQALTQNRGIQGWWTDCCEMTQLEGELCRFWFDNQQTCFTMKANKLLSDQRVFWLCLEGPNEWVDTQLWWEITNLGNGQCRLDFKHMNWKKDDGLFPLCNSTWGYLMQSLKEYCETKDAKPWFHNLQHTA